MTRASALVIAIALVLGAAGRASADERALDDAIVVASSDDECLRADELVSMVRGWLGRDAIAAEIGVVVRSEGEGASFVVQRHGAQVASRAFERLPRSCAERRAVIGLAIALAIDAAVLESIGIPAPEPLPVVVPEPDESPPPPPRAPSGERPAVSLEVEAVLAIEILPDVAVAGAASIAALLGGGARIRAGALATERRGSALAHGGADLSLVAGRVDGCYGRAPAERLFVGGCVGVLAGALLSEGRDFAMTFTPAIPWVAVALRAELRWLPWDVLALTLAAEGLSTVVRPRIEVGDGRGGVLAARSLPPVGVMIALGAALLVE